MAQHQHTTVSTTAPTTTLDMAIRRLKDFYGIDDVNAQPEEAPMSGWKNSNKFGFLKGILTYHSECIDEVYSLPWSAICPFPGSTEETDYLYLLYDRYIRPFYQHGRNGSTNSTPRSSASPSVSGSSTDLQNKQHADFKAALRSRDKVCLFCWDNRQLQSAYLIKGSIALITTELLSRAGLNSVYEVQNGVLLCIKCRAQFDTLRHYIDVDENDRLVAKVVNLTNDPNNKDFRRAVFMLEHTRRGIQQFMNDAPAVLNDNGEMQIYFAEGNPALSPNRTALRFHKTACLIWRMAGGADEEVDDDMDEDNEDIGVLAGEKLRNIQAWREQSCSAITLNDDL